MTRLAPMPEVTSFPASTPALWESRATSEHVAVGRVTLNGGEAREVITADREFLASVLRDAIAWCRRPAVVVPDPELDAAAAGYEAALAVIAPA